MPETNNATLQAGGTARAKLMPTEGAPRRLVEPRKVPSLDTWPACAASGVADGASRTMGGGWDAR